MTTVERLDAGIDRHRIRRWVAAGRLRREHVGVYTLGRLDRSSPGIYH